MEILRDENMLVGPDPNHCVLVHIPAIVVLQALARRCAMWITYVDYEGKETSRCIEPVRVTYFGGTENYNLFAWCRTRGEWRHFNIDKIEVAVLAPKDTELQQPRDESEDE